METLTLVATEVFGLVGIVAAVAGVFAARYGYQSLQASRQQLALARDQATQVPRIELMKVSLCLLREDSALSEQVSEARREMAELQRERAEQARKEQQREEREQREREEREAREREERERQERREKLDKSNLPGWMWSLVDPPKFGSLESLLPKQMLDPSAVSLPNHSLTYDFGLHRHVYEGPLPSHFIEIGIRNVGRAAAYDVTGWVWFDEAVFEPVDHFAASGVRVAGRADGKERWNLACATKVEGYFLS